MSSSKEKLVDRYVEIDEQNETNTFIHDVSVTDNYTVIGDSLTESNYEIFDLWELETKTLDEILGEKEDDMEFSDSCINKLRDIELAFNITYNEEYDMYSLEYSKNQYDQIHKIYVPFDTEYIDNLEVHKIYNSEGEFVADGIESQIGSDLIHIESHNLFVNSLIDPRTVYREEDTGLEYIENNHIQCNTLSKEIKETTSSLIMAFIPYLAVFYNPYFAIPILIYMMTDTFDDYFMRGLDVFVLLSALYIYYNDKKQTTKYYRTDSFYNNW